jgi:hypothetical protein
MTVAIVGIAEHGLEGAGRRSELQLQAEPAQLSQLRRLALPAAATVTGGGRSQAVFPVGDLQPTGQAGLRDPEVPGDLGDRRLALAGHGNHVTTELRRERLGHDADPSSEAEASQARSQLNRGQSRSW